MFTVARGKGPALCIRAKTMPAFRASGCKSGLRAKRKGRVGLIIALLMPIDPDVISQAPDLGGPPADATDIARREAAEARNNAAVGGSEFRSSIGKHITPEEFRLLIGALVVLI